MANGIVVKKPGSTGGTIRGSLIVTNGKSSTTSDGTTLPSYEPGTILEFDSITTANVSDLVDFSTDSRGQIVINSVLKAGKLILGTLDDNLDVNAGESVLVSGKIDGKVTISGGSLAIVDGARIAGKIDSVSAGSFLYCGNAMIDGKIEFTGASNLVLQGATIEGMVNSDGNTFASVIGCTIEGNLDVVNAGLCKTSGNTVDGVTNAPGCR